MIEVVRDPDPDPGCAEQCCFCRKATRYWYTPKDVACCPECARLATPEDVPTKDVWFRREQIANQRSTAWH